MNAWVGPHAQYIEVDAAGILTFKLPAVSDIDLETDEPAALPQSSIQQLPVLKKKTRGRGVQSLKAAVDKYIKDYGGGVMKLKDRLAARGLKKKIVTGFINHLKDRLASWYGGPNGGDGNYDTWNRDPPSLDYISNYWFKSFGRENVEKVLFYTKPLPRARKPPVVAMPSVLVPAAEQEGESDPLIQVLNQYKDDMKNAFEYLDEDPDDPNISFIMWPTEWYELDSGLTDQQKVLVVLKTILYLDKEEEEEDVDPDKQRDIAFSIMHWAGKVMTQTWLDLKDAAKTELAMIIEKYKELSE